MFGEAHVYVGIGGSDWRRARVREVDRAVRQPDIVADVGNLRRGNDPSDRLLDVIAEGGGFLDAHARRPAEVQRELTAVHGGEKVFFFFFNDTATTEIYTLSLHDALPI